MTTLALAENRFRQFLAHMVKFFQVAGIAAFCMFLAFADVAPLAGQFRSLVLLFYVVRQGEKLFHTGIQILGELVAETMIFYGHEPDVLERFP